jgi:hypothetical protein
MKFGTVNRVMILALSLSLLMPLGASSENMPAKTTGNAADSLAPKPKETVVKERLVVKWPASQKLQQAESGPGLPELYFPKGQSPLNWTEMGTIEFVPRQPKQPLIDLVAKARAIFLGTQKGSPNAKWDLIFRGFKDEKKLEGQFVIFKIDCPDFLSGEPGQLQLWELIRGKTGDFILQYSIKGNKLPEEEGNALQKTFQDAYIEIVK